MLGIKVSAVLAACASVAVAVPTHKHDSCRHNHFWFAPKGHCLQIGYGDRYNPPPQQNCGRNWYWHKSYKYCVPSGPSYGDAGCGDGWNWDNGRYSCVPAAHPSLGPGQCGPSYFWWRGKATCCPYGGDSTPSYPPTGYLCPDNWYWRSDGYCAPRQPYSGSPACNNKYNWDNDNFYCTNKGY
ncbi:hypothetical protein RSAG8_07778, partial [Rhizoctonia solani AG-8 WAC10335]